MDVPGFRKPTHVYGIQGADFLDSGSPPSSGEGIQEYEARERELWVRDGFTRRTGESTGWLETGEP